MRFGIAFHYVLVNVPINCGQENSKPKRSTVHGPRPTVKTAKQLQTMFKSFNRLENHNSYAKPHMRPTLVI